MGQHLTKLATSLSGFVTAAFITVLATSAVAQEQGRPVPVPPDVQRRQADLARERQIREREPLRERLARRAVRPTDARYVQTVAQVREDLERLQIARNAIVRAASTGKTLEYKFISDRTAEIKKRASRLRNNLALPDPEGDEKNQKNEGTLNDEQVKMALSILCNRIESLLKSPLFEHSRVLDVQDSTKASGDLKSILELSGSIRKSAERLKKKH